jgi:hypothetical protein
MLTPEEIHLILIQDHYRRLAMWRGDRLDALEAAVEAILRRKPIWNPLEQRYQFRKLFGRIQKSHSNVRPHRSVRNRQSQSRDL